MVFDKIALVIRNDKDILQVGQTTLSTSNSTRNGDKASEKMRTLGKVLQKWCLDFFEETQTHKAYSCVLRVGFSTGDLARAVKLGYIKEQQRDKITEVDDFMYLKTREWHSSITSSAHRQRQEMTWKAPQILPFTKDCVKFNHHLKEEERKVKAAVEEDGKVTFTTYKRMASVTLAQVILFNRRRPNEVEMTVDDYKEQLSKGQPIHDEVLQSRCPRGLFSFVLFSLP
ncbi:hypothetical protein HOLleu_02980 [Holothuria leucospilota]|uniref:Uncharacterized protein n=1 Tax=Holothuria leucospilota TaxID=206669 RepID=A0A9Q1CT45_HOLLE|nr:hypothetical protein HOLleu_02980 [Holothuria leucospilota]